MNVGGKRDLKNNIVKIIKKNWKTFLKTKETAALAHRIINHVDAHILFIKFASIDIYDQLCGATETEHRWPL